MACANTGEHFENEIFGCEDVERPRGTSLQFNRRNFSGKHKDQLGQYRNVKKQHSVAGLIHEIGSGFHRCAVKML